MHSVRLKARHVSFTNPEVVSQISDEGSLDQRSVHLKPAPEVDMHKLD